MLLADVPEALWPPFTDEPLFGSWFWNQYRAGGIVCLDDLIAAHLTRSSGSIRRRSLTQTAYRGARH